MLKSVIRDRLFPKVKFIKKETDLNFDTNSKTICGSILKWLNLNNKSAEYQYKFWSTNQPLVDRFLTQHRNNKIKKFKKVVQSKFSIFCAFVILHYTNWLKLYRVFGRISKRFIYDK